MIVLDLVVALRIAVAIMFGRMKYIAAISVPSAICLCLWNLNHYRRSDAETVENRFFPVIHYCVLITGPTSKRLREFLPLGPGRVSWRTAWKNTRRTCTFADSAA